MTYLDCVYWLIREANLFCTVRLRTVSRLPSGRKAGLKMRRSNWPPRRVGEPYLSARAFCESRRRRSPWPPGSVLERTKEKTDDKTERQRQQGRDASQHKDQWNSQRGPRRET